MEQAQKGADAVDASKPGGFFEALEDNYEMVAASEKETVSVSGAAFIQTPLKIGRVYQKTKKSPFSKINYQTFNRGSIPLEMRRNRAIMTTTPDDVPDNPVSWLDVSRLRQLSQKHAIEDRNAALKIFEKMDSALAEAKERRNNGSTRRTLKGIDLEEMAILSALKSPDLLERLHATAKNIKEHTYGNRIVTFAPLYISNFCKNECTYCAFRISNLELTRTQLSLEDIAQQARILVRQGHKRVLMVAGEAYPRKDGLQYVLDSMRTLYSIKEGKGDIRRVNANIAPLSVEDFRRLRDAGVGTYQCFQETYDPDLYKEYHLRGKKADYAWRANVFDRAAEAGIGDFGMGFLLGLADWRFEILALKCHIAHIEDLGSGAHTISFPRIEPAHGSDVSLNPPHIVSDEDFLKIISIMRLAVPYTGMIMSTRETPEVRKKTLECGISQVSAGSRTDPGGYTEGQDARAGQFELGDHRPLDEVVRELLENGFIPSWCTACETKGREGGQFITLWAQTGEIKKRCTPNALITLTEYLQDYASPETRAIGEEVIRREVAIIEQPRRGKTQALLNMIAEGRRGLCV